jgi:hypothetical protein
MVVVVMGGGHLIEPFLTKESLEVNVGTLVVVTVVFTIVVVVVVVVVMMKVVVVMVVMTKLVLDFGFQRLVQKFLHLDLTLAVMNGRVEFMFKMVLLVQLVVIMLQRVLERTEILAIVVTVMTVMTMVAVVMMRVMRVMRVDRGVVVEFGDLGELNLVGRVAMVMGTTNGNLIVGNKVSLGEGGDGLSQGSKTENGDRDDLSLHGN